MAISLKVGHHYKQRGKGCGISVVIGEDPDRRGDCFVTVDLDGSFGAPYPRPDHHCANGDFFVRAHRDEASILDLIEDLGPYEGWEALRDEYL